MNADTVQRWLEEAAASLHEQRDYLTQLDAAIGDADHGTNMDRGFTGVVEKVRWTAWSRRAGCSRPRAARSFRRSGARAVRCGARPLRRAGRALGDADEFGSDELAAALDAALDGVVELGAAQEGEKTMVDAFAPAVRTLRERLGGGASLADAIQSAFEASEDGMRATVPLRPPRAARPISASAASDTRIRVRLDGAHPRRPRRTVATEQ